VKLVSLDSPVSCHTRQDQVLEGRGNELGLALFVLDDDKEVHRSDLAMCDIAISGSHLAISHECLSSPRSGNVRVRATTNSERNPAWQPQAGA
jgi:hypothetical protein